MSDIDNVYKAPKAALIEEIVETKSAPLASRWKRFFAAFVDGMISLVIFIPTMFYSGVWEAMKRGEQTPFSYILILGLAGMIGFLLFHGYLLKKSGQTIGKKLLSIYIVDLNGNVPEFPRLIALRYFPMWIISFIPFINSLLPFVDSVFIFRKDRRCIHDLLAGTKVVSKNH